MIESLAKSSFGRAVENGLRKVGLFSPIQRLYKYVLLSLVIQDGEYVASVGSSQSSFSVESQQEYTRLMAMMEEEAIMSMLDDIDSDDIFYDVGANVGVYSCLIGDALPDGMVVAFEPQPENMKRLRENLSQNGIQADTFQKALSDEEGKVSLAVAVESHTTSPGHNLIELNEDVEEYGKSGADQVEVETVRGDDFISKTDIPAPTAIKVDVEGAELNVLKGLKDTLSSEDCRLVYCEVHQNHLPKFGASESELHELLKSSGFTLEKLNEHEGKYHLRAYK